jgi:prepilin-type N-terminal cleavage/methylation domain-containing protein
MEVEGHQVDGITRTREGHAGHGADERGFSLMEVMVAMGVMSSGLLALVGVFALGVTRMATSSPMLVAREKAREAVESVHAARDNGELAWNTVKNVADGGVFISGAQPLKTPGPDGLINTVDDGAVETVRKPGKNGILDDADDEIVPLRDFTREIRITTLNYDVGGGLNPNLRQVVVNVRYKVENAWRVYTLTTYVSSYS